MAQSKPRRMLQAGSEQALKAVNFIDMNRQSFLKGAQYFFIFVAWHMERSKQKILFNYFMTMYLKVFHSRRLFRLLKSIICIPPIIELFNNLRQKFSFQKFSSLLGYIFTALFYILDNLTIIFMIMKIPQYRTLRRISYSTLFFGLIWQTVSIFIKLRKSFTRQSQLKNELENMTPTDLLQNLNSIDEQRKNIALQLIKILCDLFPTLARTNLPQIILKTRINKGTVGFFGILGAIIQIILKIKNIPHLD